MGNGLINPALVADARPRVIGALAGQFRDLDLAEDAFSAALESLAQQTIAVDDCSGWLYVTARRKALDLLRRRKSEQRALAMHGYEEPAGQLIPLPEPITDERLRLIFICCHPALSQEARVCLTLRAVCGVPVARIASLFLTREAAMYQRITRAKHKIRAAGVPFETPGRRQWPERLSAVLLTLELAFTLAYRDAARSDPAADLAPEIDRLTAIMCDILPAEPEVLALRAMVLLAQSRAAARLDGQGVLIPLGEQDCNAWDNSQIEEARLLLDRAADYAQAGPYQTMAAIHLTHAGRRYSGATDWAAILRLYDALMLQRPGPVVAIGRAVAAGHAGSPAEGLALLNALDGEALADFLPFHAARGRLLSKCGNHTGARGAYDTALALGPAEAERRYLEAMRAACG